MLANLILRGIIIMIEVYNINCLFWLEGKFNSSYHSFLFIAVSKRDNYALRDQFDDLMTCCPAIARNKPEVFEYDIMISLA